MWSLLLLTTVLSGKCVDTPYWSNNYGRTCATYAGKYCKGGAFRRGREWAGKEGTYKYCGFLRGHKTCAQKYNYPGRNCCVCGKPDEPESKTGKLGVYMEPVGFGRCAGGSVSFVTTAEQCKAAIEDLGFKVKSPKKLRSWAKVCGCAYNKKTGQMQFNKFMNPGYCFKVKRPGQKRHNPRHMMAQNSDSWKGFQAVCQTPKPAKYFMVRGAGRCPRPDRKIQPRGIKQMQHVNYGTIWTIDECRGALKLMGKEVKKEQAVNTWAKVCGCSYCEGTGTMQFNKFLHPHYCWKSKAHMGVQDRDAKKNGLSAVCKPSALTRMGM